MRFPILFTVFYYISHSILFCFTYRFVNYCKRKQVLLKTARRKGKGSNKIKISSGGELTPSREI